MASPFLDPLLAIGAAAVVSLVAGSLLWLARRKRPLGSPCPLGWEGAALALALAAGVILVRGWNGLPPSNLNDWPAALAVLAALLALAAAAPWRWFAPGALIVVAISAPLMLAVPLRDWKVGEAALWLPAIGLPWLLLIFAARGTAERLPDAALPAWGAALAVSALLANNAGSSSTALHLGAIAAAAGIWSVLRLILSDSIRPASCAVAFAAAAPLWWLIAQTLTDNVPFTALVPIAVAPLAAWLVWPLRQRRWLSAIIAAVLAGGIAALAFLLIKAPAPVSW